MCRVLLFYDLSMLLGELRTRRLYRRVATLPVCLRTESSLYCMYRYVLYARLV